MYPDCYPLIGGSELQHLKSHIEALNIKLSPQQMEKLSNAVPFDWGFLYDMFGTDPHYLPEGKPKNPALSSVSSPSRHRILSPALLSGPSWFDMYTDVY
jgi:hypothetical protein